ncbi:UDP-3-O-(3-hydroxymyristoyl)glucosamine N-acyltransferase [Porphyromonas catoniae]
MQFSAAQIAPLIDGRIEGNASVSVSGFGKIETAKEGDLAFLANPKYESYAYSTEASILLVSNEFTPRQPLSPTLIRVKDPYAALAQLMQLVEQQQASHPKGISPTVQIAEGVELEEDVYVGAYAVLEQGVKVGRGVRIYPHAYVGKGVTIGEGATIYPHVTLYHDVKIGARCIIHAGAVIGADGFGFAPQSDGYHKIPQLGNVILEEDVEIGANTCIDRAVMGSTIIRRGVKLDNLVQIAHNCSVDEHTVMASQVGLAGSSQIGKWCKFGGQVGIGGHITIGDRVEMGGQTGVISNIPEGSILMGSPGMPLREAMRNFVIQPKLPDMYRRLQTLEKELAELKQQQSK